LVRLAAGVLAALLLVSCGTQQAAKVTPSTSSSPSASGAAAPPSPSPAPAPEQRLEASLPVALEESAAAAAGGKLYVIGGFDAAGNSLSTVWVFDGNAWSAGPKLPIGLDHTSAATLNDHVYVAGGHSFGRDSPRLFRLDGSSWTELAQMPHARGGHTLLAADGRLYAIGGNTSSANVVASDVYDPQLDVWADLPVFPAPRNHVSGFVFGANVCAAGGRAPATARVDCYDFESSTWVRFPDLPRPTSGAGAATLDDGSSVILGGQDAQETMINDQFARLNDPGAWIAQPPMLVPRHGFELAMFEGRAWACGGGSMPGLHPVATCTSVA
jgi:Kelch motif